MIPITISLIIIYILNIIDYFQTIYGINLFGLDIEGNPIARFLLENNCGWIVKFIAVPIILVTLGVLVRIDKKQSWVVYVLLVFYLFVVTNNFIALAQLQALWQSL